MTTMRERRKRQIWRQSPMIDIVVLKTIFQISTWCKAMLENIIRILNKTSWREIETLDLYWFV